MQMDIYTGVHLVVQTITDLAAKLYLDIQTWLRSWSTDMDRKWQSRHWRIWLATGCFIAALAIMTLFEWLCGYYQDHGQSGGGDEEYFNVAQVSTNGRKNLPNANPSVTISTVNKPTSINSKLSVVKKSTPDNQIAKLQADKSKLDKMKDRRSDKRQARDEYRAAKKEYREARYATNTTGKLGLGVKRRIKSMTRGYRRDPEYKQFKQQQKYKTAAKYGDQAQTGVLDKKSRVKRIGDRLSLKSQRDRFSQKRVINRQYSSARKSIAEAHRKGHISSAEAIKKMDEIKKLKNPHKHPKSSKLPTSESKTAIKVSSSAAKTGKKSPRISRRSPTGRRGSPAAGSGMLSSLATGASNPMGSAASALGTAVKAASVVGAAAVGTGVLIAKRISNTAATPLLTK